ncbi:tRNA threonylcarbamoyladenosine dehydratase [Polaribacter gangjinensis]|uniref:tRNA threonylcarbamoyladenosine dehydratase n=1 Tax=Polaribacter gangjinensis TaxID=574710 RepID=A0A2S7WF55_9FLAO|nr:tRNA threonylcarbamoyladenosine dehydratase [Polaribacter gangjinensis]PQJ75882.1 tRNA threonylcarbamoyladenosine dehydratase [Polaribacter gangjinensis]
MSWLERTELLIQKEGIETLKNAHILIVGLGGVGSFAAEFIARAGVQNVTLVDGDVFDITNINRQLTALQSTVGKSKALVLKERLLDINPTMHIETIQDFLTPEKAFVIVTEKFDFVMDCIDSISPKLNLLIAAKRKKVKVISSMGAGGKMDVSKVKVAEISKTNNCSMARVIRRRLKKEGIQKGIKVVFSEEMQQESSLRLVENAQYKKSFYGTISFMPAAFGLHAAAYVINYLLKNDKK